MRLAQEAHRERQARRLRELRARVGEGVEVVADLLDVSVGALCSAPSWASNVSRSTRVACVPLLESFVTLLTRRQVPSRRRCLEVGQRRACS